MAAIPISWRSFEGKQTLLHAEHSAVGQDSKSHSSLLPHAGLLWAMPRMQRPRRLRLVLTTEEAMDCLTTEARHHDYSSLLELQFWCSTNAAVSMEQDAAGSRALQGILNQVSTRNCTALQGCFGAPVVLRVTCLSLPSVVRMRLWKQPAK